MKTKVRLKKRYKKKSKNNIMILVVVIFILAASSWTFYELTKPKVATEWFDSRAKTKQNIILPRDDGYHANTMEWWYYNGRLITESGKEYSFHFTTFLVNNLMTHTVFHSSLGDHTKKQHYTDQSRTAGNPSVGVKNSFLFKYQNWFMHGENGHDQLKVANDQFAFDLQLEDLEPVVNHGVDGIISLDIAGDSYYYSRTRMNVTGTLEVAGIKEHVTGISWFDHQWGDFLPAKLSWDWFSLQLDNGVDLMLYQLRDKQGNPVRYSVTVAKSGTTEILDQAEFTLTPGRKWRSEKTGNSYPIFWNLKIPGKKIDLNISSIVNDSEVDARLTTYLTYWEGAVNVEGSHTGQGFMELQGYGSANK